MAKQKRQLSKKAEKLIREFDKAAQHWGWQEDQGWGNAVTSAEVEHRKAFDRLREYILKLEGRETLAPDRFSGPNCF
jgi:hypothetical protein